MHISSPEIDIPQDNPFKHDQLGRSQLEPPLTQLVSRSTSSFVLSIDGAWGTGKTTFLNMWKEKLNQDHICVKFNAWETDFASDPLIVLVNELSSTLKEMSDTFSPQILDNLQNVTIEILKRALPVFAKIATGGLLESSDFQKEFSNLSKQLAKDSIEAYEDSKNAINEFRKTLNKLIQEIPENQKIIIMIDELDRCRPSYAIELLERVKHLFNINGVVFILGIDRAQLAESVKALYGNNFDANGYLKRFIDLDYSLPKPKDNYYEYLLNYFDIYNLIRENNKIGNQEIKFSTNLFGSLLEVSDLSLRDQIQTVSRLSIILKTVPKNESLFLDGMLILLFLREWKREVYNMLIEFTADPEYYQKEIPKNLDIIFDKLHNLPDKEPLSQDLGGYVEALLIVGLREMNKDNQGKSIPHDRYDRYTQQSHERGSRTETTTHYLKDLESSPTNNLMGKKIGFEINIDRLELLNRFNDT